MDDELRWPPSVLRTPMAEDGREYGLGRDRHAAFAQAVAANLHIAQMSRKSRLVDRLTGAGERTFDVWLTRYAELLEQRMLADATRKAYKSLAKIIRDKMPLKFVLKGTTRNRNNS